MIKQTLPDIQVISFDLDDTLWNGTQVLIKAEKAMLAWMQANTPKAAELSREVLRDKKIQFVKANPHLKYQVSGVRQKFLHSLFDECGYAESEALSHECFDAFYQMRQQVELFEDVEQVLTDLQKAYRLISLTNGNADITLVGLKPFFELSLNGEDFTKPKPDPDMFLHALDKTQVKPEQVLHVGDHPNHDMLGAYKVGMKTCWLQDGTREWDQDFQPDLTIRHIRELLHK